jgi:hypothetical protein
VSIQETDVVRGTDMSKGEVPPPQVEPEVADSDVVTTYTDTSEIWFVEPS